MSNTYEVIHQVEAALLEAQAWIEKAEGDLAGECEDGVPDEQQIPGLIPAIALFPAAKEALEKIMETLSPLIKQADAYEDEMEKWNPN